MATYAVGDLQGCARPFKTLLDKVQFDPGPDRLWLVGDLVNRGPDNLEVLRTVKDLGEHAVTVLGNHDLHLLGVAYGVRDFNRKDTCQDVLTAPDADELIQWLRRQPLLHREHNCVLSHAGIPHVWTIDQAEGYAREVEAVLRSDDIEHFLARLFRKKPLRWRDDLAGTRRWRTIINYLTRMRFVAADGTLDFDAKGGPEAPPAGMRPWYEHERQAADDGYRLLFGHWAALEGNTGVTGHIALDTGCIWGNCLTMYRLDDAQFFRADCSNFG